MKKILLTCIMVLTCIIGYALPPGHDALKFDKGWIDGVDKWVAVESGKEEQTYIYGFVYIDPDAGLTFQGKGKFTLDADGDLIPAKASQMESFKKRLQGYNNRIAVLPAKYCRELNLPGRPDWLASYKKDTTSVRYFFVMGFQYNLWERPETALTYLNRGWKMQPHYDGLALELAYAYNALQQYKKAMDMLSSSPEAKANACYYYKELIFAQTRSEAVARAVETYEEAKQACEEQELQIEMEYNIAYGFYKAKDTEQFNRWKDRIARRTEEDSNWMKNLERMAQGKAD